MLYVKRNADGELIAVSREPVEAGPPGEGWIPANDDEPDLVAFGHVLAHGSNPLVPTDFGFIRVLEDLIDLLVDRAVIRFTDLPPAAQEKLMERRTTRANMHKLDLLDDSGSDVI